MSELKNKKPFFIGLVSGVVIMLLLFWAGSGFLTRSRWGEQPRPDLKITEILGLLERHSIMPFEREDLLTGMYRGLLDAVGDPYTQYFDAEALAAFQIRTEGVFAGIGVTSFMADNMLTIAEVFRNSPAEAAGLEAGDHIIAVDGADMVNRELEYITNLIRGPVSIPVTLTILRNGQTFEAVITRALVEMPTVHHEMLTDTIGLVRVNGFDRVTTRQFNTALEELTGQGMTALIIDVRNNPGGLMPVVVGIANQLVPPGVMVTYTVLADGRREYYPVTEDTLGLPLAVLVNGRSASASEILAAAVQDTGVGILVGTQTFGKGIVQNLMTLSCGNAIKMTIAGYYTPNGTSIHGVGITPCIIVEMDEERSRRITTLDPEEDVQLQAAVYALQAR